MSFAEYAAWKDRKTRDTPSPKGTRCFSCKKQKNDLAPINTCGDYVCSECWDKEGYEYDPTP